MHVVHTSRHNLHATDNVQIEGCPFVSEEIPARADIILNAFFSLHVHPDHDFPYFWGGADERGEGPGEGCNRNWPLPLGIDDKGYLDVLDEALACISDFGPRYLVVSAGFDIIEADPVGGFSVTTQGLREIGNRIADHSLPIVIVQEGGYVLDQLAECAIAFLGAF